MNHKYVPAVALLSLLLLPPSRVLAQVPAPQAAPAEAENAGEEADGEPGDEADAAMPEGMEEGVVSEGSASQGSGAEERTPYEVELTGVRGELANLLRGASTLVQLKDNPPPSVIGLRRRAETDRERLRSALRSFGHYDATLGIRIDANQSPAKVQIHVKPGPRYRFGEVNVRSPDGQPVTQPRMRPEDLGVVPGQPARASAVIDAEQRITGIFARAGYAYAKVADRKLVVDHATRRMNVDFIADSGPFIRLGEVTFNGLERVRETTAKRRITWKPFRTRYDPARIDDFRTDLADLGVFSSIRVRLADQPDADGYAPVTVDVRERERRYVALGLKYATTDGAGANATWGHRNLLGGAENLELSAMISGIGRSGSGNGFTSYDYGLAAKYKQPDFLTRNMHLLLGANLLSEHPDAYDRQAAILSAALERHFSKRLVGTAGVVFEQSHITDRTGHRTDNTLIGFPVGVTWDMSDDLLNPTDGFRLNASAAPYVAAFGSASQFTITRLGGTVYVPLDSRHHTVWAGRVQTGAVLGDSTLDIPADKRFYAGGGGSVRGYGFQKIGPKDQFGNPLGGRSLFEVGTELRFRVTENIGLVPFIDGGNVYQTEYPQLNQGLRWGAGIGVRYHTGFGPLRFDVGFPLNRRSGDDAFQIYISLGQAF